MTIVDPIWDEMACRVAQQSETLVMHIANHGSIGAR